MCVKSTLAVTSLHCCTNSVSCSVKTGLIMCLIGMAYACSGAISIYFSESLSRRKPRISAPQNFERHKLSKKNCSTIDRMYTLSAIMFAISILPSCTILSFKCLWDAICFCLGLTICCHIKRIKLLPLFKVNIFAGLLHSLPIYRHIVLPEEWRDCWLVSHHIWKYIACMSLPFFSMSLVSLSMYFPSWMAL